MKKKILIVDDENDICVTLSKILWNQGYEVTIAKNSSTALKEIKKNIIDLVLLDVWLEGSKKNGLELLRIIKKRQKHYETTMGEMGEWLKPQVC